MKEIFYGSAIQGHTNRAQRAHVSKTIIEAIRARGYKVAYDHTAGRDTQEASQKLNASLKNAPADGKTRRVYVRRKMIEKIEGPIIAAVFEVSTPSLGTGVEIAHAYLRPRMGLTEIPILLLYEKDYWPNKLSTMLAGITPAEASLLELKEYDDNKHALALLSTFLDNIFQNQIP